MKELYPDEFAQLYEETLNASPEQPCQTRSCRIRRGNPDQNETMYAHFERNSLGGMP